MYGCWRVKIDHFFNRFAKKRKIPFKNTFFIEADGDCSTIHDEEHITSTISWRIGDLEKTMNCTYLFRCHKSFLVNISLIVNLEKPNDGYDGLWVMYKTGAKALCSKNHIPELTDLLDKYDSGELKFE